MQRILIALFILSGTGAYAQDSLLSGHLTFSAYAEVYYCYDWRQPDDHQRPLFFYNYSRHNEVNLNIGIIKAAYSSSRIRGNMALMGGTYAEYNLAGEQPLLRHVSEANAGLNLLSGRNLWIDAGIMPSHIGFESAIGSDCWTLTRSIPADNSPYYEAGVRLAYTSKTEKWYVAAMYLNGWQRIQRRPGNNTPAFGTQISYSPSGKATLNWSTFVGNEYPDSISKWRYFHNLYGKIRLSRKLGVQAGFDIGMEQRYKGSDRYHVWYAPIIIARYALADKVHLALRGEYFRDEGRVIINPGLWPFSTGGCSLNLDYSPDDRVKIRLEGRYLASKHDIFSFRGRPVSWNYCITSSCSFAF